MGIDVRLHNCTPFDAATLVQLDTEGQEVLLFMVSASFTEASIPGELSGADEQLPVCFADVPFGDPECSSNKYEADIALEKPGVEVVVIGHAYAPDDTAAQQVKVSLKAGKLHKVLQVTGDRTVFKGQVSHPTPFLKMPLVWERAFGGTAKDGSCDTRNPIGLGWATSQFPDDETASRLPNITYPFEDTETPKPAGLSPVGRGWDPRLQLAGTYDDKWLAQQWPLLAQDFDPRHNCFAPPDQQLVSLPPGSELAVVNMTPDGRWAFLLPRLDAPVNLIFADRVDQVKLSPDTIILEPDIRRVTLKARVAIPLHRNTPKLREIAFGHFSPVWMTSRRKGKAYINLRGGDGKLADLPMWST